jgi:hypothetical protein
MHKKHTKMKKQHSFFFSNCLSLVLISLFCLSLIGWTFTGLNEYKEERKEYNQNPVSVLSYLTTGAGVDYQLTECPESVANTLKKLGGSHHLL